MYFNHYMTPFMHALKTMRESTDQYYRPKKKRSKCKKVENKFFIYTYAFERAEFEYARKNAVYTMIAEISSWK